jgi:peroxiredoxin
VNRFAARAAVAMAAALVLPVSAAFAFDIGPAVGTRAPALHATDSAGKAVDLRAISGRQGVAPMFFRSANWRPFRQKQLMDFREAQAPLAARGFALAAISHDPPGVLTDFAARRQIGYRLLSDQGSVTIDAFALRDPQYPPGSFAYGVPRPAIFVISRQGIIEPKRAEEGFKVRPTVQAVLAAVDGLDTTQPKPQPQPQAGTPP